MIALRGVVTIPAVGMSSAAVAAKTKGRGCAAGTSAVIADVLAGTNPTYVTQFTVEAPTPTI
jgi:hypothetical protein